MITILAVGLFLFIVVSFKEKLLVRIASTALGSLFFGGTLALCIGDFAPREYTEEKYLLNPDPVFTQAKPAKKIFVSIYGFVDKRTEYRFIVKSPGSELGKEIKVMGDNVTLWIADYCPTCQYGRVDIFTPKIKGYWRFFGFLEQPKKYLLNVPTNSVYFAPFALPEELKPGPRDPQIRPISP